MADPTAGARFSPFPDLRGVNVPTTYAGSTAQASALESVFHDVPHIRNPDYSANKLREFALSRLRVRRPLKILELVNPQLRQVVVPGRAESLAERELIHTSRWTAPPPDGRDARKSLWERVLHFDGFLSSPTGGGIPTRCRFERRPGRSDGPRDGRDHRIANIPAICSMWVDEERIGVTCRRRETNRARLTTE
jgi:hypothetical protein